MRTLPMIVTLSLLVSPLVGLTEPTANAQPSPRLQRLFQLGSLNAEITYVEQYLGPAKYVSGNERTYAVDGCVVKIGVRGTAIRNLAIDGVSTRCWFDLHRFLPGYKPLPEATMTFGSFIANYGNSTLYPECLGWCGNSADASIDLVRSGSHADNFIDVVLSTEYPYRASGPKAAAAFDTLEHAVLASNRSLIDEGKLTCSDVFMPLELELFGPVGPTIVKVGYDLPAPRCPGA